MSSHTRTGFGLPELLLGATLGIVVSTAMIELIGILWKNSLFLREHIYVQRQGYSALRLLRASIMRAGSGLCAPATDVHAIYGNGEATQSNLWIASADADGSTKVVTHSTATHTVVIDSHKVFKIGTWVLLSDDRCAHVELARIQYRDGRSYRYKRIDDSWYRHKTLSNPTHTSEIDFQAKRISKWAIRGYHLPINNASEPALYYSNSSGSNFIEARKQRLVAGVVSMRFLYGLDTDDVPDGIPNQYLHATAINTVNGWSRVRSVEINVRVRSRVRVGHIGADKTDYMYADFWLQQAI